MPPPASVLQGHLHIFVSNLSSSAPPLLSLPHLFLPLGPTPTPTPPRLLFFPLCLLRFSFLRSASASAALPPPGPFSGGGRPLAGPGVDLSPSFLRRGRASGAGAPDAVASRGRNALPLLFRKHFVVATVSGSSPFLKSAAMIVFASPSFPPPPLFAPLPLSTASAVGGDRRCLRRPWVVVRREADPLEELQPVVLELPLLGQEALALVVQPEGIYRRRSARCSRNVLQVSPAFPPAPPAAARVGVGAAGDGGGAADALLRLPVRVGGPPP